MKKFIFWGTFLFLMTVSSADALGYFGNSVRIMAMGEHLAGILKDEYTDIHRNPAYLSFVDRAVVFGQNNLFNHQELEIAPNFTNQKAGLLGAVLPTDGYGNLALVFELKPYIRKNKSSSTARDDNLDYNTVRSKYENNYEKRSIENFKVVYSILVTPTIRIGTDFTTLKNYKFYDLESQYIYTYRDSAFDQLLRSDEQFIFQSSDNSPDAQRISLGMILSGWDKKTIDFTLYYENMSYTQKGSSGRERRTEIFLPDSSSQVGLSWDESNGQTTNWATGLDANLKYLLPQKAHLSLLFGIRYGKNEFSLSETRRYIFYSSPDRNAWTGTNRSTLNDDKALSLSVGAGVEKDFSPSIKVGAACKGYWERNKLHRQMMFDEFNIYMVNDSLVGNPSSSWERLIKKTANSYQIAFPIGAEVVLYKSIKARFGGVYMVTRSEGETGYTTYSEEYYCQGMGFSYDNRIFMDAYIKDEFDRVGNWMVKVEYRF